MRFFPDTDRHTDKNNTFRMGYDYLQTNQQGISKQTGSQIVLWFRAIQQIGKAHYRSFIR